MCKTLRALLKLFWYMRNMTLNMWVWKNDVILCRSVIPCAKVDMSFYVGVRFTSQRHMCMLAGLFFFSSFLCIKNKFLYEELYIYFIEWNIHSLGKFCKSFSKCLLNQIPKNICLLSYNSWKMGKMDGWLIWIHKSSLKNSNYFRIHELD